MMFVALQGHVPLLSNPPQPEDVDIHDEPNATAVDGGAPGADAGESAGAELPTVGDSEDSNPLQIKRTRSSGADGHYAANGSGDLPSAAPSAVPHPSAAAPKRRKFGKLLHAHLARARYVWFLF